MTKWTIRLIVANVAAFVLTQAVPRLMVLMMLVPARIMERPWTAITYMFMHAGFTHILFNMLGLYFFGPQVETELGGTRFLTLYFISGLAGAALSFVFTPFEAIVGASGAIFGIFLAFAYFWPRERIYIWGILPIEARWLVVAMTGLSLFGGFGGVESGVAHFAHLGGFAGAYLYLRWVDRHSRAAILAKSMVPATPAKDAPDRWARIDREKLHEVNRSELDRIRMKLATGGPAGLTRQEIEFLDRFSEQH